MSRAVNHIGSLFLRTILLRMKQLGVSQTELAKRMKVSRPYITKVLRQDVNFSFRTAARLARALEMDFFPELRERGKYVGYCITYVDRNGHCPASRLAGPCHKRLREKLTDEHCLAI